MAVPALALKALGVGVVAVPAVGLGITYRNEIGKFFGGKGDLNAKSPDKELIKILEDEGDIIFGLSKDGSAWSDDNISFSTTDPQKITITANISTSSKDKIKLKNNANVDGKIEELKKLNPDNSQDWTWECEIVLTPGTGGTTLHNKEKLKGGNNNEGLFDILAKDLSGVSDKKEEFKNVKIQFIKNCSSIKGASSTISANKLTRTQSFTLETGNDQKFADLTSESKQETSKLYFADKSLFNKWFATPLALTKWDLHVINLAHKDGITFEISPEVTANTFSSFSATNTEEAKEVSLTVNVDKSLPSLNADSSGNAQEWKWKCIVKFVRKASNSKTTIKQKNQLIDFFGKLKKPAGEEKNLKIKFIEDCATYRTTAPATPTSEVTVTKTFNLKDESGGNALVFEREDKFNHWFKQ